MFKKRILSQSYIGGWCALAVLSASLPAFAQSFQGLGDLPGGQTYSIADGVSANGMVVVGVSKGLNGEEAFIWTEQDGTVGLGELSGGIAFSRALAVSADGAVVVGSSISALGVQAFYWTEAAGMVGLDDLRG